MVIQSEMLSNLDEGFAWIESLTNFERKPMDQREYRLDRMFALLDAIGNPQLCCKAVHVSGSKGKGSTAVFIACQLASLGFSAAVYSSPHVLDYRERFQMYGGILPDATLLEGIRVLHRLMRDPASAVYTLGCTTFELLTALFFWTVRSIDCDYMVLETGIGGRLDATNVLPRVEAAVCTSIELEHTDILGSTYEAIAKEKAGIIKAGCPVFIGRMPPAAAEVFRSRSHSLGAPMYRLDDLARINTAKSCIHLDAGIITPQLQMLGAVQLENAALAAIVVKQLQPGASLERLSTGLSSAHLLGRMQLIPGSPPVILDGAHTVHSIYRNMQSLKEVMPSGGVLVFGAVHGKNISGMAEVLTSMFRYVVICRPGTFKPSDSVQTAKIFRSYLPANSVIIEDDPYIALQIATSKVTDCGQGICITGSFFLVGKMLSAMMNSRENAQAM